MTKEERKRQIDEWCKAWSSGHPIVDDNTYDRFVEEYVNDYGESSRPYTRQSQGINDLVGTLPKLYGVTKTMRPEQKSYVDWMRTKKLTGDEKIIIQPKWDGVSIAYDGNIFCTRGDYDNGESVDVTDLFNYRKEYLDKLGYGKAVKFEAIMSMETFKLFKNKYLTPRDVVSAAITSRNKDVCKLIDLIPLRYIDNNNNQTVSPLLEEVSITTTTSADTDTIARFIDDKLNDGAITQFPFDTDDLNHPNPDNYAIDGVVVSVVDNNGVISEEVAIKILLDVHDSHITNIEYQLGLTGKITPVAIIEPTAFCDGKRTVDHIGLSTLKRVRELNLRYGDTVRVMYNIVPYLIDSKHDGTTPFQIPTKCPVCGADLDLSHLETVRCMNPDCDGRKVGDITRYVVKMNMKGISKSTITKLYESGLVRSIVDLYKLTKEDIMNLDGYKDKSSENIINTIRQSSQDCPVSRWLGALPFKDIDSKTWDIILNLFVGDDELKKGNVIRHYVLDNPDEFLSDVMTRYYPGIGPATLAAINEGWMRRIDMMKELIQYISFRVTSNLNKRPITTYVTFTGCRDEELTNWLLERGIGVIDFSNRTQYLIIPNKDYQNTKTQRAKDRGLYIIPIDDVRYFFEPF